MLCSNCSHEVKPVVAVDVDGTLGDYHSHFIDFAVSYTGYNPEDSFKYDYQGAEPFKHWFMDTFSVSAEDWRQTKLAYRQGGMKRSMPVFPWAKDILEAVRGSGAELWITTTRPYLSLDNIVPDTVEWLNRNGLEGYSGLLFDEDKYAQLAERVDPNRIVAVVDDLREMCQAVDQIKYGTAMQLETRWNSGDRFEFSHEPRDIISRVKTNIEVWRSLNA